MHAGALWSLCMPGRGEGSSRAMLATARPSCYILAVRTALERKRRDDEDGRRTANLATSEAIYEDE